MQFSARQAIDQHVLLQAGCGMGETLGFWIPLPSCTSDFLMMVTPLTLPSEQRGGDIRSMQTWLPKILPSLSSRLVNPLVAGSCTRHVSP